jgi:hypothetical protein
VGEADTKRLGTPALDHGSRLQYYDNVLIER